MNGKEYKNKGKGVTAAVLSAKNGEVVKVGHFDMVDDMQASIKFVAFIETAPFAAIVLISTYDDATVRLTNSARNVIASLGAKSSIGFRNSFALVAQKDTTKPIWFREKIKLQAKGPAQIIVTLWLHN